MARLAASLRCTRISSGGLGLKSLESHWDFDSATVELDSNPENHRDLPQPPWKGKLFHNWSQITVNCLFDKWQTWRTCLRATNRDYRVPWQVRQLFWISVLVCILAFSPRTTEVMSTIDIQASFGLMRLPNTSSSYKLSAVILAV